MARYEYWASCPDFSSGEIIHYITDDDRSNEISYATFARNVNLKPLREQDHPAMYRISAPDNWAISFHRSQLPTGQRIYYFDWSRIEHIFVDPDDGFPNTEEMVELARQLEFKENPDRRPHEEYEQRERDNRLAAARDFPETLLPTVLSQFPPDRRRRIPVTAGQRTITVYRSLPPEMGSEIRPGDWVTLTREYAKVHGRGKIISKTVPVEHVMWSGTDEDEWFYTPPITNSNPVLKRRLMR